MCPTKFFIHTFYLNLIYFQLYEELIAIGELGNLSTIYHLPSGNLISSRSFLTRKNFFHP